MATDIGKVGFVLLVLMAAVSVPVLIDATEQSQEPLELSTGETQTVNHNLNVRLDSTDTNNSTATVTLTDSTTLETDSNSLSVNQTVTTSFDGGNVSTTLTAVSSDSAMLTVGYPATYGWGDGARTIADNFPVILVVVIFVMIMGIGIKQV